MKIIYRITSVAALLIMIATVQSCKKDDSSQDSLLQLKDQGSNTFYGPTVPIGNGVARAWVQENKDGDPLAVGIDLSDRALEGLPTEPTSWVLYFPPNKGHEFYKHMLVDWNPQGHEPPGVYDLPHFDFHFYTITNEERLMIGPAGAAGFDNLPPSQYVPPAYIRIPGGVPQMGTHWADVLAPEFNGGTFTKTFIWGSWDGSFVFWEPMITRAYLMTQPDVTTPVRQPSAYQQDGWYPMGYKVAYSINPKKYTVALVNLAFQNGQ